MANSSSSATVNLPPPSPCCSSLPPNGGGDQLIILRRGRHQMGTLPTAAADGSRGRQATGQQRFDSKQQPNSFPSTKTAANRSTGSRSRSRVPMCFLSLAIGCRLSVLFLLLLCLAQCPDWANSRPTEPSGPIPVGGIFTMDIEAGEAAPKLPTWIKASQDGQQLFGIPQQKDLGQHNVQLTKGSSAVHQLPINFCIIQDEIGSWKLPRIGQLLAALTGRQSGWRFLTQDSCPSFPTRTNCELYSL
jgi:hypothetical protein